MSIYLPTKTLSWKPRRRGQIYCAPACGRGCTYAEYVYALVSAQKLARRLSSVDTDVKGGSWKIRVFENLGWHWSVSKGSVTVTQHGSYSAYLNTPGPWGGNMVVSANSPRNAVNLVLAEARRQLVPMVALAQKLGRI